MKIIKFCLLMFILLLLVGCAKPEVINLNESVLGNMTYMEKAESLVVIVPGYELVQSKYPHFFVNFARVYELERGVNIELSGLAHSEFNHNNEVSYDGTKTKLYDLYVQLITATLPQE